MARRTFFSFHYAPDVQRAQVVKYSWITKDREDAGFFDSSAMEKARKTNPDALRSFLIKQMEGSSVVCALVGTQTAYRPWVRYEIMRGLWDQRGLLAVRVHTIKDFKQQASIAGVNPFSLLGIHVKAAGDGKGVYLVERDSLTANWTYASDFTRVLPKWPYGELPAAGSSYPLRQFFPIYEWASDGHADIGSWIEDAATKAGR